MSWAACAFRFRNIWFRPSSAPGIGADVSWASFDGEHMQDQFVAACDPGNRLGVEQELVRLDDLRDQLEAVGGPVRRQGDESEHAGERIGEHVVLRVIRECGSPELCQVVADRPRGSQPRELSGRRAPITRSGSR